MSDEADTDEFDSVRTQAVEALDRDDVRSMYVGLIHEDGAKEYYFANTVDETELRQTAATQLGMMTRVLAEKSVSTVAKITDLAAEQAESIDLRS